MNRNQAIALAIAAANVVAIILFPPFDVYSIAARQLPVFGGFDFYFNRNQYMIVNTSVLALEFMVVLVNAAIAVLLLGTRQSAARRPRISLQHATLVVVAVNLIVILLFPPFESVFAVSKATLPTFEGFYFIFAHHSNLVIVTTILYLEVAFVLVNGALFWLIFHERKFAVMTRDQMYKTAQQMRQRDKV
jgi:hypothetical protein